MRPLLDRRSPGEWLAVAVSILVIVSILMIAFSG